MSIDGPDAQCNHSHGHGRAGEKVNSENPPRRPCPWRRVQRPSGSGAGRRRDVRVRLYERARTDEVDDEAAIAVAAGGHAEEGPAVGRRRGAEER